MQVTMSDRSESAGQDRLGDELVSELRHLLAGLAGDGRITPSVYDTAQAVLHAPDVGDRNGILDWLIEMQRPDGGWNDPDFPKFRIASTLAAMLALQHAQDRRYSAAIDAGCAFLERQAAYWGSATLDDIPVGLEIIWPRLQADAHLAGLRISLPVPDALRAIGQARLAKLNGAATPPAGHPALHCWEAWGSEPVAASLGPEGSLAISPAATAAWLRAARHHDLDSGLIERAGHYLRKAAQGSDAALPGVCPYVWPLDVFECAYALYSLGLGGLQAHPALAGAATRASAYLDTRLAAHGASFAAGFDPDGDTTAVAIAAQSMAGRPTSCRPLAHFVSGDVFATCPGERNPSLSTTVHAMHALRLQHEPHRSASAYLLAHRDTDGLWRGDKWHASPFYLTCHAVAALDQDDVERHGPRTLEGVLTHQHASGGWAGAGTPNFEETAYAVLTIDRLCSPETMSPATREGLLRALRWMLDAYRSPTKPAPALWIGKELFRPTRVVRAVELTGLWTARRRAMALGAACC
ncbi:prenyltransferase/squalene oxidase repeat-containing protein [Burkholderia pyrrocinia]|uniref:prenyltransferase/squalene oxidase repeat-containing protein n=1 Tax=Burkholderia pyrrocinia TaxID=60550 RepID=UPI002AB27D55|nr:prenyltransferase/squalene oxidase repeat-containing protein [Burkholderia pyrrocinia]